MDTNTPTVQIRSGFLLMSNGLYAGTFKITLEYNDSKGWIIRCYDQQGQKLGSLIPCQLPMSGSIL